MHSSDKFKLQLSNIKIQLPQCFWNRKLKIKKLYDKSESRIEKLLDLKKLVKNIWTMKAVLKHSYLTETIKKEIGNMENHVIDLDESNSSIQNEIYDSK